MFGRKKGEVKVEGSITGSTGLFAGTVGTNFISASDGVLVCTTTENNEYIFGSAVSNNVAAETVPSGSQITIGASALASASIQLLSSNKGCPIFTRSPSLTSMEGFKPW